MSDQVRCHTIGLLPAEKIALTVALARLLRGDEPLPNTTSVCVLALARVTGVHDYTKTSGARVGSGEEQGGNPECATERRQQEDIPAPTRDVLTDEKDVAP